MARVLPVFEGKDGNDFSLSAFAFNASISRREHRHEIAIINESVAIKFAAAAVNGFATNSDAVALLHYRGESLGRVAVTDEARAEEFVARCWLNRATSRNSLRSCCIRPTSAAHNARATFRIEHPIPQVT
jgi:hypothetical protein